MKFFSKDKRSAFEAKEMAQWIAFGPVIFQAARVLRDSGILTEIENSGAAGINKRLYIDGVLVTTASGASLSYGWNMNKVATGSHSLKVVANDAANNTTSVTTLVTK